MKKVLLVSHDAGGAEVLSSWLKYNNFLYILIAEGPARNIFLKKNFFASNLSIKDAIKKVDFVITSSSWQSDLEKETIYLAKQLDKYVITMLDHWTNYRERFIYKKNLILPNEIWVLDECSKEIAESIFKNTKIILKDNFYLNDILVKIRNEIQKRPTNNKNLKGIFIGENISDHAAKINRDKNVFGYDEKDSLDFLLENIPKINLPITEIKIRPHPSENCSKYNWVKNHYLISEISSEKELWFDICHSDIVFGCESMALVIAIKAEKKVISCIPKYGRNCSLPFKEIIHLKNIV